MLGGSDPFCIPQEEATVKTLLVMGEYKVTSQGGWVNLWHHDEIMQTLPRRYFPKKTVDRVVFVAELIHGEERAKSALFSEFERRGYKLTPVK
jgi:hypothetical protein